jgi:hypothetical protein
MSAPAKRNATGGPRGLEIPPELRLRLAGWIDVDEVGATGFWLWLETVLPLLPDPNPDPGKPSAKRAPGDRVRELARDLVDCARERARLNVFAERYFRDNQVLARRVKALEATLRTRDATGRSPKPPHEGESGEVTERYLPQR